jgi:hypothetical protein
MTILKTFFKSKIKSICKAVIGHIITHLIENHKITTATGREIEEAFESVDIESLIK